MSAKILIVGAGRRVTKTILPALVVAKINIKDISILRNKEEAVYFRGKPITTFTSTDHLDSLYDIVLICVPADMIPSEVSRQRTLFPAAYILADTPSGASLKNLIIWYISPKPFRETYALEDWLELPNLRILRGYYPNPHRLTFGHFGTINHFLSVWRTGIFKSTEHGPIFRFLGPKDELSCIHSHFMGTTRMGNDPETSVTNEYGSVHGYTNVFVSGPSLFTSYSYANPMLTIVALAVRVSRGILRSLESEKPSHYYPEE